jgi:hypothetical protein
MIIMKHLECNRLIYNQEYGEKERYYENLGIDMSSDENIEKYIKKFISFDPSILDTYYQDEENDDWTIIEFNDMVHLIDIHYTTIQKARESIFKMSTEEGNADEI